MRFRTTEKKQIRIGICGADRGLGATQLSLMFSEYAKDVIGKSSAIIDLSESRQLKNAGFLKKTLVFGEEQLDQMGDYEYLIFDFGCRLDKYLELRNYLDVRIIVSSILPWKSAKTGSVVEQISQNGWRKEHIVVLSGSRQLQKAYEKLYNVKILRMPFVEDPFFINQKSYDFLRGLLPL